VLDELGGAKLEVGGAEVEVGGAEVEESKLSCIRGLLPGVCIGVGY